MITKCLLIYVRQQVWGNILKPIIRGDSNRSSVIAITLALLLMPLQTLAASNYASNHDLAGFKQIKFNLSVSSLKKLGLNCGYLLCDNKHRSDSLNNLTFLGQSIYYDTDSYDEGIDVWLSDPKKLPRRIDQITFYVGLTGAKVSQSLKQNFGNYIRSAEWDYWFFKNGATIATYNPAMEFFPAKTIYYAPDYGRRILKRIMPTWLLEGSKAITLGDY
jgi:hypothetical protein